MQAEVISIGDELTSGQRLDTNSQWLSERLGELGIRVLYHTTVGDDLAAGARVFREAFDRADVIVCTGGLGPTADDLTRQSLADSTGCELVRDEPSLEHIKALFARRKRPMPEQNVIQAMFPSGSRVIPNPHGSAPGIDMDIPRESRSPSRIFALPGVPAEMREMWDETVEPSLRSSLGDARKVIRHRRIKCFGIGESDLESMLPDLIKRGRHPSVGITVSRATITLRITAEADSEQTCFEAMEPTIATIHQCLGSLVFGEEDDELQHAVMRILRERDETLALAEVGTGGLVSEWLSEVSGPNDCFMGGIIVHDRALRTLNNEDIHTTKQDSIVAGMAHRSREQFSSDYGLAIGRFPDESNTSPPGNVELALATSDGVVSQSFPFAGHPDILTARTAKQSLNLLRLYLLGERV